MADSDILDSRDDRVVFDPITVRRSSDGYRATTPVPTAWSAEDGILGGAMPEGPYVEGVGRTTADSINALERAIGRIVLAHFGGRPV